MASAAERSDERGFTLLELVIAMSLLAVMMAMSYSVFATALTAVPRGEAAADRAARLRMGTSLLSRQVRSMIAYPAWTDEELHPYFRGDQTSFDFVTASPQLGGGEGLGWVRYWIDGRTLWMGERVLFSTRAVSGGELDPESQTMLVDGLTGTRFRYLRQEGTEGEWLDQWDAVEEGTLPAAIEVALGGIGPSGSYWIQEIPVMTVVYGLGSYDPELGLYSDSGPPDDLGAPDTNGEDFGSDE